jgi:2-enoate reductase
MRLFERGQIGKLSIKNRIYMLPMRPVLLDTDGSLSQRAIDFYTARAKGGAGIISTSLWMVDRELEAKMENGRCVYPMTDGDTYIDRISQLADSLHDYDAKLVTQLSAGFGRILPPWCYSWQAPKPPVAPSAQPWLYDPKITARELTREEIRHLVRAFENAGRIMHAAGVDAAEIQGVSGYLIDQFMTAVWNHRTDEYGGNLDGRLRFLFEIFDAIKSGSGGNLPVIFRYSLIHGMPGGREMDEGLEIARRLEKYGVDALSIVIGCHESKFGRNLTPFSPAGEWANYTAEVKKVVRIPVIAAGRLGFPDLAEKILEDGKADFIGLGRGLLADPEWPNKVRNNRADEIITCIACGDGCQKRANQNKYVSCALNPVTGMEKELALTPAKEKKTILVVGGGPAGMEAARVARLRGHDVTLWEKGDRPGGSLIPAAVPDFKQELANITARLSRQIQKLGVRIELNHEATRENIDKLNPDVVFVATGSQPLVPRIEGIDKEFVITAVDFLQGKKQVGDNVAVIGGGAIGAETALHMAQMGKKVTLIEMLGYIAADVFDESRKLLLLQMDKFGVTQLLESKVTEFTDGGVIFETRSGNREIKVDTVVLALGLRPETRLLDELSQTGRKVVAIGDCVAPRKILEAIWEGYRRARIV